MDPRSFSKRSNPEKRVAPGGPSRVRKKRAEKSRQGEASYSHGFALPTGRPTAGDGLRTADVLVDVLVDAGIEVVFGIPGGAIAPLHDALIDHPEIRVVTTRHESGAMFAAAAYARMTGKVGVVLVTSGPGLLNAVTGLASAYCDGLPVLLLAGEVPRSVFGRHALQEGSAHHLDVITSCRPLTKMAAQIPFSDVAPSMVTRAIATALSGRRGPVLLTLPLDVLSKPIHAPRLVSDVSVSFADRSPVMSTAIREVSTALARAERPLIFAGSGTRWADGPQRLRVLAERLQIPVMTTPKGKGVFPESHPLSLGVFGYGGHPSSSRYLEGGIDVLLTVGSGLGDVATNGWSKLLAPTSQFIQIDADALQIGRNYPVSVGLVGDAAALLAQIVEKMPNRPVAVRQFGVERFEDPVKNAIGPEGLITPMRAIWELQRRMPDNTIYTCDIGEHLLFATHYLHIDEADAFLIMTGLGSMGSSIAGALGAKLGKPARPVAVVCGDGCFSMNMGDLAVAVKERIPIVVAVLNDQRYGMVEIGNTAVYGRTPDYSLGMDVAMMARSVGAHAIAVDAENEILDADLDALGRGIPIVLDVRIDRQVRMPRNERFDSLKSAQAKPSPTRLLN